MKLIQRTNRNFLLAASLVLPVAGCVLFFSLRYFVYNEVDEQLKLDEQRIIAQLKKAPTAVSISPILEINPLQSNGTKSFRISTIEMYDSLEKEDEMFRELHSICNINGQWYTLKIRHALIESEDFVWAIGLALLGLLTGVIGLLYYFNYRQSQVMWRPFYKNLQQLKQYRVTQTSNLVLEHSPLEEFEQLNRSLLELTSRIQLDYKSLKEFTENASHEIQTPLALLSMQLEEILQSELNEEQKSVLYRCYQSVHRLSKLNEKLLLLTKLDNDQFQEKQHVNFTAIFVDKLDDFSPLFKEKELIVSLYTINQFWLDIDPYLADLLSTNLLSNIFKHTPNSGRVSITLNEDSILLQNTFAGEIELDTLFDRFKKGTSSENSTGLGLAIAQRIVSLSELTISVEIKKRLFSLEIKKGPFS